MATKLSYMPKSHFETLPSADHLDESFILQQDLFQIAAASTQYLQLYAKVYEQQQKQENPEDEESEWYSFDVAETTDVMKAQMYSMAFPNSSAILNDQGWFGDNEAMSVRSATPTAPQPYSAYTQFRDKHNLQIRTNCKNSRPRNTSFATRSAPVNIPISPQSLSSPIAGRHSDSDVFVAFSPKNVSLELRSKLDRSGSNSSADENYGIVFDMDDF